MVVIISNWHLYHLSVLQYLSGQWNCKHSKILSTLFSYMHLSPGYAPSAGGLPVGRWVGVLCYFIGCGPLWLWTGYNSFSPCSILAFDALGNNLLCDSARYVHLCRTVFVYSKLSDESPIFPSEILPHIAWVQLIYTYPSLKDFLVQACALEACMQRLLSKIPLPSCWCTRFSPQGRAVLHDLESDHYDGLYARGLVWFSHCQSVSLRSSENIGGRYCSHCKWEPVITCSFE